MKGKYRGVFGLNIAKYLTADNSVFLYSNANDMRVTQDLGRLSLMRTVQLMKKCQMQVKIYSVCTT